jgi:hypothetical protein
VNTLTARMVAAVLAAGWAGSARPADPAAPEEPVVAFSAAARISAAFPMGSLLNPSGFEPLLISELVALSIPLQLDVGVAVHRRWFVGAYAQYAWSFLQVGECKVGESCSVTGLRVGLEATYAFRDGGGPWVGLGTGWEWMFVSITKTSFTSKIDVSGWEFANFQAGWDVEVSPGWKVGPWASLSVGQFSDATRTDGQTTIQTSITNTAVHGWLQLGVKGSFGP